MLAKHINRTNTILYCDRWQDSVAFYRDVLGLPVTHATDWFVEVHLHDTAHLSLADASRSTIDAGHGAGITLSVRVTDLDAARSAVAEAGVPVSEPRPRWGSRYVEFRDPEGVRVELWSDDA